MITRPTLIVVGAGASCCYEVTAGVELRELAIRIGGGGSARVSTRETIATAANVRPVKVLEFCRDLARAGVYSIDEFVESRPDCLDISRVVIASLLGPQIARAEQRIASGGLDYQGDDWTRYVLSIMSEGTQMVGQFRQNAVRFVIFNFDPLLELRIRDHLTARYAIAEPAADALVRSLSILHPHGILPHIPKDVTTTELGAASKQIRLVHDAIDDSSDQDLDAWVREAKFICFLGFSYHPINLGRLTGSRPDALINKHIFGSAYHVAGGDRQRALMVLQRFGAPVGQPAAVVLGDRDHKCETFLRENYAIR